MMEEMNNATTILFSLLITAITAFAWNIVSIIRAKNARKEQLQVWANEAVQKSIEKKCLCLSSSDAPQDNDDATSNEKENIFSAVETQNLIKKGTLDPAKNLCILAKRCERYGRNNSKDTGINAITEQFYDEEYEVAKKIRSSINDNNNYVNDPKSLLLYGVPISIKDCLGLKGALQTGGLACRTNGIYRSKEDSVIVEVLRKCAGALPMVRGNVPQIMMLPETFNYIWGRTRNPWNTSRVPGGSSGGDAALVAMKCVPIAVGSDVAGSIRIPAAYCGVIGFKPTSTRLTQKGCMAPRKNNKAGHKIVIPPVPGPIARTVDDCALLMEAVCVPELFKLDPNLPPLPFNKKLYNGEETPNDSKQLKIGYFYTDGWFEPCTAAKRGLTETIHNLKKAGHVCVPIKIPTSGWDNYPLLVGLNAADGCMRAYVEALEGEKMIPQYTTLYKASIVPNMLRPILKKVLDKRRAALIGCTKNGGIAVHEYWQLCADLLKMRDIWADAMIEANIDAIIHPALPTPALPHDISGDLTAPFSYTFIANMLQWPAGVVPVTTVKKDEQHYNFEDIPIDQRDKFAKLAQNVMEGSEGLPLSVAVMTPAFQDELCLRVMKEIESITNFQEEPQAYKKVVA